MGASDEAPRGDLKERGISNQQRLAREHDRLKLLLDINNAVVSHLTLDELLHVISESLKRVVPHDSSTIGLYDPETKQLRAPKSR